MSKVTALTNDAIPVSRGFAVAYGMCEAVLIQQLHFLLSTQGQSRDGRVWHTKSYQEWASNIMMFGARTIRYAFAHLEELGIVTSGNYNPHLRDQRKWYTLNYELLGVVEDPRLAKSATPLAIPATPPLAFSAIPLGISCPINKVLDLIPEKGKEISPSAGTSGTFKIPLGKQTETTVDIDMKTPTSSAAILQSLKEHNGTAPSKLNTSSSLQHHWRRLVPKHHPSVGMLPEFKKVEVGQLSHISKSLGAAADKTIQYIIPNWIGYCNFVASQAGLKKTPDVPQIGFLLKHVVEAANYAKDGLQLIAPKKVQAKVVPAPVVVNVVEKPESVAVEESDEIADANFMLNWKPPTD